MRMMVVMVMSNFNHALTLTKGRAQVKSISSLSAIDFSDTAASAFSWGKNLGQLDFNVFRGRVQSRDAELTDLAGANRFRFGFHTRRFAFPARLQQRTER